MDSTREVEIPVLKEAFAMYEPRHETTDGARSASKNDRAFDEKAILIEDEKPDKNYYGSSSPYFSADKEDLGSYPPGISVAGSSNLPVPDLEPKKVAKRKKKRKKKKNKVSEAKDEEAIERVSSKLIYV